MSTTQNNILMEVPARLTSLGGGAEVQRLLPYSKKRMVGPFIFFDYLPKTFFPSGEGLSVRPHPHIGLSTLSYLLAGEILHHDSLGFKQVLRPGDVNWMTAGRGISHSEQMTEAFKMSAKEISLLQFWVALPKSHEDVAPSFHHHAKSEIPTLEKPGAKIEVIAGSALGKKSPVQIFSKLYFLNVELDKSAVFEFDPENQECAFFIISGNLQLDEQAYPVGSFVILSPDTKLKVVANEKTQFVVLGGDAFPEARHIYWNFVSSEKDKIEEAKKSWQAGTFPLVPGEPDIIPLPPEPVA